MESIDEMQVGLWASWIDATRKRKQRKLEAHTLEQARNLRSAERARVEKTVTLGNVCSSQIRLQPSPHGS
jgi:hypothetical protein